jgi:hypothetical protein
VKHGSIHSDEAPVKFINAITSEDWRTTIAAFLQGHFIAEDKKEEKRMVLRARNYTIINEDLYRKGVCAPLLKCISRDEGKQLNDIHFGMCSSHIRTRALVGKAFIEGFYWRSAVADANVVVRTCPNYQKHVHYSKFSPNEVNLIPPFWPLARWGIDIVDPMPIASSNYKYAAVAVEYFTKWVEAKPLQDVTA